MRLNLDINLAVYVLSALQLLGLMLVGWLGWRIARGPLRQTADSVKNLAEGGKQLAETGKGLAGLAAQAKAVGESARATRAAVNLAPPPAGMLLTPQRLLQGIGLARTAHGVWKNRQLPKKKPSLALKAAMKLGLVPPAALPLLRGLKLARTTLGAARAVRKK